MKKNTIYFSEQGLVWKSGLLICLSGLFLIGLINKGSAQGNTFPASGNVGIGTTSPVSKLTVIGDISTLNPNNTPASVSLGWLNDVARIRIGGSGDGAGNGLDIQRYSDQSVMRILGNGNVGIGTTTPADKLSVNGDIRAREIKVETANWPDYVFAEEYQLPNLKHTEDFIKKYKRLPGMPSAAEAEAAGISLGAMNRKLLEKVEELTLHLIEKEKEKKIILERLKKQEEEILYIRTLFEQQSATAKDTLLKNF